MHTNLKTIVKFKACADGITKLMNNLGHKCNRCNWRNVYNSLTPEQQTKDIDFKFILESNGVKDTFWALRTQSKKTRMLISVDAAHTHVAAAHAAAHADAARADTYAAYVAAYVANATTAYNEQWKKNEEILLKYI